MVVVQRSQMLWPIRRKPEVKHSWHREQAMYRLNQSISRVPVSIFDVSLRTMAASQFRSLTRASAGLS